MTILEAQNTIIKWFVNDTSRTFIDIEEELESILLNLDILENEQLYLSVFTEAINQLCIGESSIFTAIKKNQDNVNSKFIYVLNKPVSYFDRTISISPDTAINLADLINIYLENAGEKNAEPIDIFNISEVEIKNLITITHNLLSLLLSNKEDKK